MLLTEPVVNLGQWNHMKHVYYTLVLQLLPQWVLDVILFTHSAFVDTLVLRTEPHMPPSLAVYPSRIRCHLSKGVILSACSLTVTRLQAPCSLFIKRSLLVSIISWNHSALYTVLRNAPHFLPRVFSSLLSGCWMLFYPPALILTAL